MGGWGEGVGWSRRRWWERAKKKEEEKRSRGEVNSARAKNEISRPSPRRQRGSNPHLVISIRFY